MSEHTLAGWSRVNLTDLATYINGYAFKPEDWSEHGLPIVRIAQITGSSADCDYYRGRVSGDFKINHGDIVFSWSGTLCVVEWTGGPAWLNQHLFKVKPAEGVSQRLLYHVLSHAVAEMDKSAHGSTMKHIKRGELKRYQILFPDSRQEQEKIGRVLDTLDTQIQKTEALIAKLEKVKEGMLHDLLTRGIDENGQLRPSPEQAPERYKTSPLGLIPREWSVGSLEDVGLSLVDGDRGPNYPSDSELYSTDGFCLFLSAKNVTKTGFKFKESQFITKKKDSLLGKGKLQRDDIVITTRGTVGNFAYYDNSISHDNIRINSGMLIIRNSRSRLLSSFAYTAFKEHYFDIELNVKGSGSAQPQLPARDFKSFSLPAPSFDEQAKITRAAEPLMSKIQNEVECLTELKSLKAGLMDDLLTGRVRVTPLLDQAQATTSA